jgi:hypothetical protein
MLCKDDAWSIWGARVMPRAFQEDPRLQSLPLRQHLAALALLFRYSNLKYVQIKQSVKHWISSKAGLQ